uniref:Uncharacterized protein n=1 Tax=Arundo donax TaxID=35708 RepID=A0A0A8Z001_ARUDO
MLSPAFSSYSSCLLLHIVCLSIIIGRV